MKSAKYKYIFSLLVLIVAIGCNGVSTHNGPNCQEDVAESEKPRHPFESDDTLLYYNISDSVYHNLKRRYPNNPKWSKIYTCEYGSPVLSYEDYMLIDSMARQLYSPENFYHVSDEDYDVNATGLIKYLNWELWGVLKPYIGRQRVVNLMEKEMAIADSLISAQRNWFKVHFDAIQGWVGTISYLKYYRVEQEMLSVQNENMKEILHVLTDSTYSYTSLPNIPTSTFNKAYKHILTQVIPYYKNDTVYNANEDRMAFLKENQWWDELMITRRKISSLIRADAVNAFDNGTCRLKINRLRQLKNEFENYNIISQDVRSCLLCDTCTYQQLMAYPNFSTKLKEYNKELYDD